MTTDDVHDRVSAHYSDHYADRPLKTVFREVLSAKGKGEGPLTTSDLAAIDHFHFGGAAATAELAKLLEANGSTPVLDVGGGFGGPARMLAETYQCPVTVLDLTREYCEIGEELTTRCSLDRLVSFRHGNALDIPYPNATFDRVWTLHSSMNIEDKSGMFREIHRVLRPGGRFLLYENMAGSEGPLHFPVPWARDQSISFLLPPEVTRDILIDTGFEVLSWDEVSEQVTAATAKNRPAASSLTEMQRILGEDFLERLQNGMRNLAEHRAVVVRAVLQRV